MHKPIEMSSRLFNLLPHIIIAIEVEDIGHEIQRVLVVLYVGIEPCQVEAVGQIVFIDFAKIFVASRGHELFDPRVNIIEQARCQNTAVCRI